MNNDYMPMKTQYTCLDEQEKQKPLNLYDIAPRWAKRLERNKLPFPLSPTWLKWYFELDSPSKCIVGEAYGYSALYEKKCKECDKLGWQFGHSFLMNSRLSLQRDVKIFVEHWTERHNRSTDRHRTRCEESES